jgi:hypothetical protein
VPEAEGASRVGVEVVVEVVVAVAVEVEVGVVVEDLEALFRKMASKPSGRDVSVTWKGPCFSLS